MGKSKHIETPEKLYELFEEYKMLTKSKYIKKMDFKGKDGDTVYYELEQPLTESGFRVFARSRHKSVEHYFANTGGAYDNYRTICRAIKDEIRTDQIVGGMVGIYNPSITQRLNGLADNSNVNVKSEQPLFGE